MPGNEQIIWRDPKQIKLPPLNYVLTHMLTLPALQASEVSDLTTLGTASEDDSLVTGLRGRVALNDSLMRWTVRWDWSASLGIHINYWYEITKQRISETFAFCVERKPPKGRAAKIPPNHFYAILRMATQDAEFNHSYRGMDRLIGQSIAGYVGGG